MAKRQKANRKYNIIGTRIPLVDSRHKVTGEAVYTEDISFPGMLVGRILRSPHPHARIKKIDTSKAEALPGVVAVCTGVEAPITFGVLPISKDENALAVEKVRYVGDSVAAVAAEDVETAERAINLIEVEYEELPVYTRPIDCTKTVEEKIHKHCRGNTNVHKEVRQHFGNIKRAFHESDCVKGDTFKFDGVTHAFTEPHCCIAVWEANDRLSVYSAQQVPHYLHRALSEVLEVPMHQIRVVKPAVGGGFGGKSDPFPHEIACALLARKANRPVKITFTREEVFLSNHGRHPSTISVKMGVDKEGMIQGIEIDALIDGGAYASFGVVSTYYNGVLSQGPYRIPNFKYRGRRVYTNTPPSGAMRGHGSVNTRYAIETVLDMICDEKGLDPCEVRLKNCLPEHTATINQFRITSNGIQECIERARDQSDWNNKYRKLPYGRGIGIGCGFYISGSNLPIHWTRTPQSTVHLKVDMDGGVTLHTGASDIGQGSDTMAAQCVAEVLGLSMDYVHVKAVDSDLSPIDLGSYSSRVTFMNGNAAREAAEGIAQQLAAAAAKLTGVPAERFVFHGNVLSDRDNPSVVVPYMDALTEALAETGALIASGKYLSPKLGGKFKGAGAGLSPTYSFQAFVAEVTVDPDTGIVTADHVWAAHDVGKALNPLAVEGQIEGSVHMGLGQALSEYMHYRKGQLLNANLLDYRCVSPIEMPPVDVIIVESDDPEGPFGAKECGEGALAPIIPAVANAIYDAVGVRVKRVPVDPDFLATQIARKQDSADKKSKKPRIAAVR
jgi:4-hydroxybenzoyl-CoA reductase subunit alpha